MSPEILFLIFYLAFGLICLFAALFNKRAKLILLGCSACFLSGAIFNLFAYLYLSDFIWLIGNFFLIGLFLFSGGIMTLHQTKRCTVKVDAKIIGIGASNSYRMPFKKRVYLVNPKYRYRYNGRIYEGIGIAEYSEAFFQLMSKEDKVEIFIDPNKPYICTDKKYSSHSERQMLITGCIFMLLAIALYINAVK